MWHDGERDTTPVVGHHGAANGQPGDGGLDPHRGQPPFQWWCNGGHPPRSPDIISGSSLVGGEDKEDYSPCVSNGRWGRLQDHAKSPR